MADDHNQRPYRTNDPYGRGGAPVPAAPGDPLAELARLIGQNDPFSEFGRDGARRSNALDPRQPPHDPAMDRPAPPVRAPYPQPSSAPHDPRMPQADPHYPAEPRFAGAEPPFAPPQAGYPQPDMPSYGAPGFERQGYGEQPYNSGAEPYYTGQNGQGVEQAPNYGYAPAPQDAHGFQNDRFYHDNVHMPAEGEDLYDDAPRPRRRGLIAVAAVVALAVIGTAGAFGYRAIFGPSGSSPPPVIKAETAPSKVVPAGQNSDPQSSKLLYDRVGSRSERVVSREEQPIDLKDSKVPPRVIFPGPGAASGGSPSAQSSMPPSASALASTEPKKIRTLSIKPDQVGSPPGVQPAIADPVSVTAKAAPVRSVNPPLAMMDTGNGASAAPVAPRATARPSSPPPAANNANAPLSLLPEGVQEPTPMRTASAAASRAAAAPPVSAGGGSYVQVSSQRSESEAQASFQSLQGRFPNVLGGRAPVIRRADLGDKGTYYRAMVGPFATAGQANELCSSLKAAGGQCIVQRN